MNEDHARRVAEIEALTKDYCIGATDRVFELNFRFEELQGMRDKWAFDWQRIANTFAVPVGHFATRPGMTYIGPVRPDSIIGDCDV